jgi:uronate dehydrogenase
MKKRILITGGLGTMGRCIAEGLEKTGEYEVLRGTRKDGDGKSIVHIDYENPESLVEVLKGVHTVIHMAFHLGYDHFLENHIGSNLTNAYYLYEAARINGVKRVIFASSNHIFGFYKKGDHITSDSKYRPDGSYGLSKVFVETLGRYYSDRFGISVFNIRIGNFSGDGNLEPHDERSTYIWLSNADCQQLFRKCVEHDENCLYLEMFGMSNNSGNWFDTSDNSKIGYEPQSDGVVFRGKTKAEIADDPASQFARRFPSIEYVGGLGCAADINGKFDADFIKKHSQQSET